MRLVLQEFVEAPNEPGIDTHYILDTQNALVTRRTLRETSGRTPARIRDSTLGHDISHNRQTDRLHRLAQTGL
jgi:hypothetical protein